MHPDRAFRVINLMDIPENKHKFWPQEACVILRISDREILDVIQFYSNSFIESEKYQRLYPGTVAFFVHAGDLKTVEELNEKISWCFTESKNTFILGENKNKE
jgi:hypothetical protein